MPRGYVRVTEGTAASVILTFFGAIFALLTIGAILIVDEAEMSRHSLEYLFLESDAASDTKRAVEEISLAPPIDLPIGDDRQGVPTVGDFLINPLRRDGQLDRDRYKWREGILEK